MLKLLMLICAASSRPVDYEEYRGDSDDWTSATQWIESQIGSYKGSDSSSRYKYFKPHYVILDDAEDRHLFKERMRIMGELEQGDVATHILKCRAGPRMGIALSATHPHAKSLEASALIHMTNDQRTMLYMRMAKLMAEVTQKRAFITHLNPDYVSLAPGEPATAEIDIYREVFPVEKYMENMHAQFLGRGLVDAQVDFARYYPKYVLQMFILAVEDLRRRAILDLLAKGAGRRAGSRPEVREGMLPLLPSFMKIVDTMLDKNKDINNVFVEINLEVSMSQYIDKILSGPMPSLPRPRSTSRSGDRKASPSRGRGSSHSGDRKRSPRGGKRGSPRSDRKVL